MLSLYPQLETDDDTMSEIIFLVDRSGSMAGINRSWTTDLTSFFAVSSWLIRLRRLSNRPGQKRSAALPSLAAIWRQV